MNRIVLSGLACWAFSLAAVTAGPAGGDAAMEELADGKILISKEELRQEMQRVMAAEHLTEEDGPVKLYRAVVRSLEAACNGSDRIEVDEQWLAMMTGGRLGRPDPWREIPAVKMGGRKVQAVGIYLNLAVLEDQVEQAARRAGLKELVERPEWRDRVLESHTTAGGLMLVVARQDVAPLEHAIERLRSSWTSAAELRMISRYFEGSPGEIRRRYVEPVKEHKPISLRTLEANRKALMGQEVTVAAYLVDHRNEDLPDLRWIIPAKDGEVERMEGGLALRKLWECCVIFRTGQRSDFGDVRMDLNPDPEKPVTTGAGEGIRPWSEGRPVLATGTLRTGDFQRMSHWTWHDVPYLELRTIRETTAADPVWAGASSGP